MKKTCLYFFVLFISITVYGTPIYLENTQWYNVQVSKFSDGTRSGLLFNVLYKNEIANARDGIRPLIVYKFFIGESNKSPQQIKAVDKSKYQNFNKYAEAYLIPLLKQDMQLNLITLFSPVSSKMAAITTDTIVFVYKDKTYQAQGTFIRELYSIKTFMPQPLINLTNASIINTSSTQADVAFSDDSSICSIQGGADVIDDSKIFRIAAKDSIYTYVKTHYLGPLGPYLLFDYKPEWGITSFRSQAFLPRKHKKGLLVRTSDEYYSFNLFDL